MPGTEGTFGSTSTSLRVWKLGEDKPVVKLYASNKSSSTSTSSTSSASPPMTSFDWNPQFSHKAATCSVDTTVAVWDVERGKLETQLIAHDKAVFDLTYNSGNLFSSVSFDGSLRQFDARDLDHSTILYEDAVPLLRVASPTKSSSFLIVVLVHENPDLLLFDTRKPGFLSSVLRCGACPNAIAWSGNGDLLAAGLADGTCAIFSQPGESTKMKPSKLVESLPAGESNAGGVTNISWAGNVLSLVNGNSVVHKQL